MVLLSSISFVASVAYTRVRDLFQRSLSSVRSWEETASPYLNAIVSSRILFATIVLAHVPFESHKTMGITIMEWRRHSRILDVVLMERASLDFRIKEIALMAINASSFSDD